VAERDDLHAAVAAGIVGAEDAHRELLRSIVDVARAIFAAQASSIFLLDEAADELVFEAVSGQGSDTLVGKRFPAGTGIAGWCLVTRQPLVIEDVTCDPRFGRAAAEATGYVPTSMMAVPLVHADRALGVLEVLDRDPAARGGLDAMALLAAFANQAAIALDLLQRARRGAAILADRDDLATIARLAARVEASERREAALGLVNALDDLLRPAPQMWEE
jgi:GAF domain-containing protein